MLVFLFVPLFYEAVNLARLKLQILPFGQQFKPQFSSLSLSWAVGHLPHMCMVHSQLEIWTESIHRIGGFPSLGLTFLRFSSHLPIAVVAQTLSSSSSSQEDCRFSIGVLAALPSLVWELPLG